MKSSKTKKYQSLQSLQYRQNYCFQLRPSHLTLSHNFLTLIKPQTFYQLHLVKDSIDSSQINKYQNLPLKVIAFNGKIILTNIHLSFTVQCNKQQKSLHKFYLKLYQLGRSSFEQDIQIGQYQLQINRYISKYRQNHDKYYYQQCDLQAQIYLTFQLFVEKNRVELINFISQEKKRQKHQMKKHILSKLQQKRKNLQKTSSHSSTKDQLKQSIKLHLKLLEHLQNDEQAVKDEKSKSNFKKSKTKAKQSQLFLQSPQYHGKNQILSQQIDQFSVRNSQIQIKEEFSPAILRESVNRNTSRQLENNSKTTFKDSNSKTSFLFSNVSKNSDSQLLKNQSHTIQIQIKTPKQADSKINLRESLTVSQENTSQRSENNQYQKITNLLQLADQVQRDNEKNCIRKSFILDKLDYAHQGSLLTTKIAIKDQERFDVSTSQLSQISVGSNFWSTQTMKTKMLILMFLVVTVLMFIYLIDHPYFDIFQGKNDAVISKILKGRKKGQNLNGRYEKLKKNNK